MSHPKSIVLSPKQIARFWGRVDQSGGAEACWPWIGSRTLNGYGRLCLRRQQYLSHRVAYWLAHGGIDDILLVCHNCPGGDNRACCNPRHLWLGTAGDNNRDRVAKGREGVHVSYGERNGLAKLTEDKVRAIRIQYAAGFITLQALADFYGVSLSLISQVVNRRVWKHVV